MGINRDQVLDCFLSDDLIGIGMEADAIRRTLHPENVVTYALQATIPCTEPEVAPFEYIADAIDRGASGIRLQISNTDATQAETTIATIRHRFPSLALQGPAAAELRRLATTSGLTLPDLLAQLQQAGLDTISGETTSCTLPEWLETHRTAHTLGMRTTAHMVFGAGETTQDRVDHLTAIHNLQRETGGFTAFLPTTHQPTPAERRDGLEEPTAVEYLKTLAISRMFLDTIDHIQADLATQGLKVLQMALRFGASDAGAIPCTGPEEEIRRIIRDAGLQPIERDTLFRVMLLA
jgi:cyclic dehypoxanthinyl futalosine synthase